MRKILCFVPALFICLSFVKAENTGSCNAAFTYYISQNVVYFQGTDSVTNGGYWNFGDGSAGWGFGASHAYNTPGSYSVLHVITDSSNNCRDSSLQIVQVNFTPGCSISIQTTGDSTISGGPAVYPNQYTFAEQSTVTGSTVKSITWTVDSTTVSTGSSMSYTFQSVGNYNVCAQLQTYSGCVATDCKSITVTSTDSCSLQASFTYAATSTADSLTISFTPAPNDSSLSYNWYFGDGGYSTTMDPQHAYPAKGIYYTTLVVKKNYGTGNCVANFSGAVYVNIGPSDTCSVTISYSANPGKPNSISLIANGGQPLASQEWLITKIPDSIQIALLETSNPTYLFTQTGYYEITLKATTVAGCVNYAFAQINIDSIATAVNSAAPDSSKQVSAYPNPATNQVSYSIVLPGNASITTNIYSSMGNLMLTKQNEGIAGPNNVAIPVQSLPSGMYYIEIQYGNTIIKSRFQKL